VTLLVLNTGMMCGALVYFITKLRKLQVCAKPDMMIVMDVSAIVLAGGKSRRLGMDKTALRIGGQTLLARTVDLLVEFGAAEVIIVTNTPAAHTHPLARCVTDVYPGMGTLGGIYSGLAATATTHCLAVAADMPFLNGALLGYLASLAPGHDVVVPAINGIMEPLHAVYERACLPVIRPYLLGEQTPRIIAFYDEVTVRRVQKDELVRYDPLLLSFFNINTPEDVESARRILGEQGLSLDA
jgi:molybdopterin-guanine dinucleotide biosynthesis protein A